MTFEEFRELYDKPGSIVLLEGKRNVLEIDKEKLTILGKVLTEQTKNITFRSGNADGADYYFSHGVSLIEKKRLQVIVPFSGHRKNKIQTYEIVSLDDIKLVEEPEIIYQSKKNKKTEKLIDPFVAGDKNRFTLKAAYIIRDTIKVLGTSKIKPATFGIFYDDLENPMSGGTGHTMNVCKNNAIPFINQAVWFNWLSKNTLTQALLDSEESKKLND